MRLFSLCTFVRFETMIWPSIRFDYKLIELWKALRHFLTANRKKTFQRIFSYNSGRKRKLWAIFLPWVRLWKKQTPEAGLKHKLKLEAWRLSIFRDNLILVFLNENCCHRIIFLLLIVSSLSCNFNFCADCFQSFGEHRLQEYSKCRALNH